MAGTGVLVAIHWVTFFAAIKASTVSLALAVMATVPFFVSLIEPVVRRRKPDVTELLLGLVAIMGLWWMYRVDVTYGKGMVLALISAFCAALFGTLNSIWSQRAVSLSVSRLELAVACLVLGGVLVSGDGVAFWPSSADWGWLLLLLGLVATSIAFAITVEVMRVLSPFTVAMAINLEPVYAILLALVLFGEEEVMPPGFWRRRGGADPERLLRCLAEAPPGPGCVGGHAMRSSVMASPSGHCSRGCASARRPIRHRPAKQALKRWLRRAGRPLSAGGGGRGPPPRCAAVR